MTTTNGPNIDNNVARGHIRAKFSIASWLRIKELSVDAKNTIEVDCLPIPYVLWGVVRSRVIQQSFDDWGQKSHSCQRYRTSATKTYL